RLALQTREQHIRREKATSNICTAQVLLAVMAGLYAAYHGPDGLRRIATRGHPPPAIPAAGLDVGGGEGTTRHFFYTAIAAAPRARRRRINLRVVDADTVGIALDETTTPEVVERVWDAVGVHASVAGLDRRTPRFIPEESARTSAFLTHPVFHRHHSETEMLR